MVPRRRGRDIFRKRRELLKDGGRECIRGRCRKSGSYNRGHRTVGYQRTEDQNKNKETYLENLERLRPGQLLPPQPHQE